MKQLFALVVCLMAASGFMVELSNMLAQGYALPEAGWRLLFYFTILTNLMLVGLFGWLAIDPKPRPSPTAGATAAIVLVGVVYWALLEGVADLDGASPLGNYILHKVTPVLAAAYWLFFTPKGSLSWRDPIYWCAYPLAYLVYALLRGAGEGRYPYPFIDLALNGWSGVLMNSAAILLGFLLFGSGLVLIDKLVGKAR
ncbi:Pr6Pr family membrane protein [Qipengyuania aquimaris]|uniref:Pr6Pr family membrane protein n=1 Tax=Qipengyuania aquimaris TaxID=255984 RepID=UPI001C9599BE|nr:Pr6Pr family membrane protein [Qipengyuania aquimaris]MBY6129203.1 Pr6Pr family membrane protein [Qipengyuania aquimaris]